jgi:type I restriction enzyme, S subunit
VSELPDSWAMGTISDLVDVAPKSHCTDSTVVGFVPMNRMGKTFRDIPTFETRKWSEVKKGYTHFADGDVLVARITPCFENGKAGIARGLPNGLGAGSTEYVVLRPKVGVATSEYVLARLKTDEFLFAGARAMTGAVGQQRVPKSVIESYPVPIAPFPEQQRISLKLTALLADVDACRERLDRVPQILKKFREAVLEAAVSGRLTEEWRIAQAIDLDAWSTASVESLCTTTFDGPFGSHLKSSDYSDSGIRVVRLENIGHLQFRGELQTFVTRTKYRKLQKHALLKDDVVFSSFVDEVVRVCLIPESLGPAINKADCFCLRISADKASPKFVAYRLATPTTYSDFAAMVRGVTRPRVNISHLKKYEIAVPPIGEQIEIVRRVDNLFEIADSLQRRYLDTVKQVEKLTPSVLAKAFRGELVPQDPNDEPAGEMLERIRIQKENDSTSDRPRRNTTGGSASNRAEVGGHAPAVDGALGKPGRVGTADSVVAD